MAPRLTLLLGKPPKPGTLLAEDSDYLTARGLHTSVAPLLAAIHDQRTPLCNPWPADQLLRDRRSWHAALEQAGVPVPPSVNVADWPGVRELAGTEQVVAKALAGPGRGATVVTGTAASLPGEAPFPGPYLVEPRLAADGTDRKLYVAGSQVRGLLKPSTLTGSRHR